MSEEVWKQSRLEMVLWSVWLSGVGGHCRWSCVLCSWGTQSKFTKYWSGAFASFFGFGTCPPPFKYLLTHLRDIIVFLRSVQSTENRKSHTMDLCVTSYGPTLTVNLSHWASFLLISPTRFVPFFFLFVLLFHTRYPRLGIITSRSRLSFWCRYNEKLCS